MSCIDIFIAVVCQTLIQLHCHNDTLSWLRLERALQLFKSPFVKSLDELRGRWENHFCFLGILVSCVKPSEKMFRRKKSRRDNLLKYFFPRENILDQTCKMDEQRNHIVLMCLSRLQYQSVSAVVTCVTVPGVQHCRSLAPEHLSLRYRPWQM